MPDLIERSLECSSLFMAAELLEQKPEQFGYVRIHQDHIDRIRAVASRMSIELEELRLRREIESEDPLGLNGLLREICSPEELERMQIPAIAGLADVARGVAPSSPPSDAVVLKRYLELDQCLA